jgi:hypothetical protein
MDFKNLKENANLESCSSSVKRGIKWLKNELNYDRDRTQIKFEEAKKIKEKDKRKRKIN